MGQKELDINVDIQNGYNRIECLLKQVCPDIDNLALSLIKTEIKHLVSTAILNIGNHTNSLTHTIEIK